ncbi:hypothetical protein [Streptomyces sp. NPDC093149]|uniref:hypothetical protein n=1 Tax=Streptomyces sp. NPDC093149 TaxID=3366031 RepID=UPI0038155357
MLDADHQALGRDHAAPWALTAGRLHLYTEQEAARFHAVQRALYRVLPRMREEVRSITTQARPLMPAQWGACPVEHRTGPVRLPLPASGAPPPQRVGARTDRPLLRRYQPELLGSHHHGGHATDGE